MNNLEQNLLSLPVDEKISFMGKTWSIQFIEKPKYSKGEGKTDLFIQLMSDTHTQTIKLSVKQPTADFMENKVSAERAEQLFGNNYAKIIKDTALSLYKEFLETPIYYPEKKGNTRAGSYTMGWRLDIVNKSGGRLSAPIHLSKTMLGEILSGTNLPLNKRDCYVQNMLVKDGGIANYYYAGDGENSIQQLLDKSILIEDYVSQNTLNWYFAFKAVNYRSLEDKIDGNRPLAVRVNWSNKTLCFDQPLQYGAKDNLKLYQEDLCESVVCFPVRVD